MSILNENLYRYFPAAHTPQNFISHLWSSELSKQQNLFYLQSG